VIITSLSDHIISSSFLTARAVKCGTTYIYKTSDGDKVVAVVVVVAAAAVVKF
jgi:membrane-bound acyltransferase YfiQ involved in biofilm formation